MHDVAVDAPTAKAIFGDANPIGQVLKISDTIVVRVAGVFGAFPENSSFNGVHFLAPWSLYEATNDNARRGKTDWGNNSFNVFVQLRKSADVKSVSAKIRDILLKTDNPPVYKPEFFVFPISRWRLYRDFHNGVNVGGFIEIVRLFVQAEPVRQPHILVGGGCAASSGNNDCSAQRSLPRDAIAARVRAEIDI